MKFKKIEDCKTLPEFFGVDIGDYVWIEGTRFLVDWPCIYGDNTSTIEDGKALLGCITGQLEWSKTKPPKIKKVARKDCAGCKHEGKYENEIEYGYPTPCTFPTWCERIASDNYCAEEPKMTEEEEKLIREIAVWFPLEDAIRMDCLGVIKFARSDYSTRACFGLNEDKSKAYELLAPILQKHGEINLDDYR